MKKAATKFIIISSAFRNKGLKIFKIFKNEYFGSSSITNYMFQVTQSFETSPCGSSICSCTYRRCEIYERVKS
jgi:hypothetical protein